MRRFGFSYKTGVASVYLSGHKAHHEDKPKLVPGVYLPREVNKNRQKVGLFIKNEKIWDAPVVQRKS